MINPKYNNYLAKIFRGPIIKELASEGDSDFIRIVLKESGFLGNIKIKVKWDQLFESVYAYLKNNYRSEYVYKNAIANKILLGRHSLNTSTLISEFRVSNSKADIVILNGTSSVYEIKTAYDNLDRLEEQIKSYKKVFDLVNVITDKSHIHKLKDSIHESVGLFVLTNEYTIKNVRLPISNKSKVDPSIIFDSLRKNEYLRILKNEFNFIPDIPNTKIYSESKKFFCELSPEIAHDKMVEELNRRASSKRSKDFILKIPQALKGAGFSISLNRLQMSNFLDLMKKDFNPV